MSRAVGDRLKLSKQQLLALGEDGSLVQTGGESIDDSFELPQIGPDLYGSLPSIETFVVSIDRTALATGSNEALNAAWSPTVSRLAETMLDWLAEHDVELGGDSYITVSITAAGEVNGEAHFDDDYFDLATGTGVVATVGDLGGTSVATAPLSIGHIRPHQSLTASDDIKAEFASGGFGRVDYAPNQLVALPQFGQLHAGPGPCGGEDEVRHLMVFRTATKPSSP